MNNSFYEREELETLGIKTVGHNVKISRKASFYSTREITIGNHVRIDDFCILSGKIHIGSYVHISAFCALYGKFGIELDDFSGLSPRTTVFSATDDFSGSYMIGPLVPSEYIHLHSGVVKICKFAQIGAGSIVMPNLTVGEGAVSGAFSFITQDLMPWTINTGIPTKKIKDRNKDLLNYHSEILKND